MEKPSLVLHHHLHTRVLAIRRTWVNRIFALVYSCAMFALLYHHVFHYFSILILVADVVLAFMWATHQSFRMFPIRREVFPENLAQIVKDEINRELYPAMDVFICTADPYKEPPMCVVNTALSVMAYDYPAAKLSVYVSDDGGSQLTLFALMEAAKFAAHWLPYCRNSNIVDRCPEAYFESQPMCSPQNDKIKLLYENMKTRVENVVDRGSVNGGDYNITDEHEVGVFSKWMDGFTNQDHPSIIQVLLESGGKRDVAGGHEMPNLIYVSREKIKATSHHFKAGALNVLLRVSATMTNAPVILTIDCDMYSNDPKTPLRALCYFLDPSAHSELAYLQFPQRFTGINDADIYGAEFKGWTEIDAAGFDGILGPNYMGTGCFFKRRAFFGGPSSIVLPEAQELSPHHLVNKPIRATDVLTLAHHVAGCYYEDQTQWGCEMGFYYGSLVEDFYTGFRLHSKGWKSIFCNPNRPAFLGNAPITLHDLLIQTKRWSIGLLDMAFCKYSPLTFGIRSMNIFQALGYTHYSFWPIWSIPITIYAFLPQTALINFTPVFPKVSDPWLLLYAFLFIGAYVQDFLDFTLAGGTVPKWWSSQRMWMMRGISSFPFASLEFILGWFGLSSGFGFSVTSKVVENEQNQRYDKGSFEFGVPSPLFYPVAMAAIMNLMAFCCGIIQIFRDNGISYYKDMFVQMFIAGFVVVNSWPIYEAMILRTDKGKMPVKVTLISAALAWVLYLAFSLAI